MAIMLIVLSVRYMTLFVMFVALPVSPVPFH